MITNHTCKICEISNLKLSGMNGGRDEKQTTQKQNSKTLNPQKKKSEDEKLMLTRLKKIEQFMYLSFPYILYANTKNNNLKIVRHD